MIHPSALVFIAAMLIPAAANAATYSATPRAAPAAKRVLARDMSWACGPAACVGSTEESRPLVLCQGLAKQVGRLESFRVDGRALGTAQVDKCNGAARGAAPAALARN